jgi:hypothetical protein
MVESQLFRIVESLADAMLLGISSRPHQGHGYRQTPVKKLNATLK